MKLTAFAGFSVYFGSFFFSADTDAHGLVVLAIMVLFLLALTSVFRIIAYLTLGIDRKFASNLWLANNTLLRTFYSPKGKVNEMIWITLTVGLVISPLVVLFFYENTRDVWGVFAFMSCYGLHAFWGLLDERAEQTEPIDLRDG